MSEATLTRTESAKPAVHERRPVVAPPVDIFENDEKLLVVADVPGVAPADVAIHFEKGTLTFEGKRSQAAPAGAKLVASESRFADYRRSFALPQGVDADKISAELDGGVLRIHLPKQAALRPRQIPVRAG